MKLPLVKNYTKDLMNTYNKIMKQIRIGETIIGDEYPCFIIAELSANHNGSLDTAIETIRAAKRTGADCIKLQTFTADTITLESKKSDFKINQGTLWDGQYLHDLYKVGYTPWEWHEELMKVAKEEGLICFSSPFDKTAVDFLETLNVPAYKIASFEITDIPLIEYVASKGKPIIISTGIAEQADIELALDACKRMGNNQIALLKCTSSYPAPIEEANMCMVKDLAERYNVISGLSDHTMGATVPVVATCFGAKIIEKHFILDRSIGGSDAAFSMNEGEFTAMVKAVREAESAIGIVDYSLTDKQAKGKDFSRSLYVVEDIKAGEVITEKNVKSIRPGFGLHPKHYNDILGKIAKDNLEKGTRFSFDLIE
jgi:pseudaminic acid synthase